MNKVKLLMLLSIISVAFNAKAVSDQEYSLNQAMRKLWSDHVFYTRLYIISELADLPDLSVTLTRLSKNQEDIGNAIVPYFGADAGKQLTKLLKEHIVIAGYLVTAAKEDKQDEIKAQDEKWHKNAEEIAEFLSNANSNWPKQDLVNMLNEHLKLTKQEAVLRLQKNWKQDISNFDEIYKQILGMADALTKGIVAKFPEKFGGAKKSESKTEKMPEQKSPKIIKVENKYCKDCGRESKDLGTGQMIPEADFIVTDVPIVRE